MAATLVHLAAAVVVASSMAASPACWSANTPDACIRLNGASESLSQTTQKSGCHW